MPAASDGLSTALAAAAGASPRAAESGSSPAASTPAPLTRALLLGAGGHLGSAMLAETLVAGRFATVQAWVATATVQFASALRGLVPLTQAQWDASGGPLGTDTAFIVFERQRFSNGRDDAFVMPDPAALVVLARRLREGGVRHLLVVLPHAASMLPHALTAGLASHDEAAVAALGFEHLVLFKPSLDRPTAGVMRDGWLQRFAAWWLSQLRWMVPEREQPLRAAVLARLAVQLARLLPNAPPGTRVVPQVLLWQLARDADGGEARARAWLSGPDNPPP